ALGAEAYAAPAKVPGSAELSGTIERIIDSTPLGESRIGVLVWDLEAGRPVYEQNADELLNPASNAKLLTSVAALARLGPGYRYPTELFVDAPPAGGVVKGRLYLRGKGDPSLDTQRLHRIVRSLKHLGLKEVRGDLVV